MQDEADADAENHAAPLGDDLDASSASGSLVGPYELIAEIAVGGQASVWRALDRRLGRIVALKILRAIPDGSSIDMSRFLREAEVLARIRHPGVAEIYDIGVDRGRAYISMPLLSGETLEARLIRMRADAALTGDRTATGEVQRTLTLIERLARALGAVHKAGAVHRDVKPANVLIEADDRPVLVDFGLAHIFDETRPLTIQGDVLGTPGYIAPEQLRGTAAIDARADVFALGVILFESLALRRPFEGRSRETLYRSVLEDPTPDIVRLNPAVSSDLRAVVECALEKEPERRYATATAFADDLLAVLEGRPVSVHRAGAVRRGRQWAKRRPLAAAALALTIVGLPLATAAGIFLYQRLPEWREGREVARRRALDLRVEEAFWETSEGDRSHAVALFRKLSDEHPDDLRIAFGLVYSATLDSGREAAMKSLEEVKRRGRVDAESVRILSTFLARFGQPALPSETNEFGPPSEFSFFVTGMFWMAVGHQAMRDESIPEVAVFSKAHDAFRNAALFAPMARATYDVERLHCAIHMNDAKLLDSEIAIFDQRWGASDYGLLVRAAALRHRRPERALAYYERAIASGYAEDAVALAHAGLLSDLGRLGDATKRLLGVTPSPYRRRMHTVMRAQILVYGGRLDEAVGLLEGIVAAYPNDVTTAAYLAVVLDGCGRTRDAIAVLEKALETAPGARSMLYDLAVFYGRVGEPLKAAETLRQLIASLKTTAKQFGLDEAELRLRQSEADILDIESVRALKGKTPALPKAAFGDAFRLAIGAARLGDFKFAAALFRIAEERDADRFAAADGDDLTYATLAAVAASESAAENAAAWTDLAYDWAQLAAGRIFADTHTENGINAARGLATRFRFYPLLLQTRAGGAKAFATARERDRWSKFWAGFDARYAALFSEANHALLTRSLFERR